MMGMIERDKRAQSRSEGASVSAHPCSGDSSGGVRWWLYCGKQICLELFPKVPLRALAFFPSRTRLIDGNAFAWISNGTGAFGNLEAAQRNRRLPFAQVRRWEPGRLKVSNIIEQLVCFDLRCAFSLRGLQRVGLVVSSQQISSSFSHPLAFKHR